MQAHQLKGKVALVTGASRGIGASTVQQLAEQGVHVVINYRSKGPRAETVAEAVKALGVAALLAQADLTSEAEVAAMIALIKARFGHLDLLVLNASGGLEKDKLETYAMELNLTAQVRTLEMALPLMTAGSRVVFVTSHWAHFYREKPVYSGYEMVARSKRAGEDALRDRIAELSARGISLVVVSGDMIEGTITPKLLEREAPGIMEFRRQQAGALPTVEEFASEIVRAAGDRSLASGDTVFVGSTD